MGELLSQLWSPQMQAAFTIVVMLLVVLYVLSIIWVVRDAYLRGVTWWIWGIVALIPIAGIVAYCLLRPPMLQLDKDEQELEVALKKRQLMRYGECAICGYPVEVDYVMCPNCHTQLKNLCVNCGHALDPAWTICPYCATPVGMVSEMSQQVNSTRSSRSSSRSSRSSAQASSSRSDDFSTRSSSASPSRDSLNSDLSDVASDSSSSTSTSSSSGRHSNSPRTRNANKSK